MLARKQTDDFVRALVERRPNVRVEVVEVHTRGDADQRSPIAHLGVGVFVSALEDALLRDEIDIAVHSLKDLPSEVASPFTLAAISSREDPRDALVNRWGCRFDQLPTGARIGTSSPRRRAQLLSTRPDLEVVSLRGNVDTRVRKALGQTPAEVDGAILAAAGLLRTGLHSAVAEFLDPRVFVPAAGQGALAIETLVDNTSTADQVSVLSNQQVEAATAAERAFLRALGGGCSAPISAYAEVSGKRLTLTGFLSDLDGKRVARPTIEGDASEAAALGTALAQRVRSSAAFEVLVELDDVRQR